MSNSKYRKNCAKPVESKFHKAVDIADEFADKWFVKHGGKAFYLLLNSAEADLELHLLESKDRKALAERGTEPPKRWQVAPGVAATCRAQVLKLVDRIEALNERKLEMYASRLRMLGFNADGTKYEANTDTTIGSKPTATQQEPKKDNSNTVGEATKPNKKPAAQENNPKQLVHN